MFLCLREDLKEKSGRLKDFCLSVSPLYFLLFSFFLNGPGRTVMCSLYIYTSQYLKENFTVRCIIFSLRTDIGKQTITFFATRNNNPIFHYLNVNTATYNFFIKKKETLGLEKPASLSVLE